ncbi:MAG: hypothetical protein JWQ27_2810, partial [Ferruginibacter sp.]|nr:hypothetical protein [Ferruginibacter sp.]
LAICNGATVVLTSSPGTGFLWSTGATTQSITVSAAGTYSVTHTSSSGCTSAPASVQVTVNALPATPTITSNGPLTICSGATVVLTSSSGSGYLWNTGATTQSITVNTAGNYSVTHTSSSGCTSAPAVVQVTVNAIPPTPVITSGGPLTFCNGESVLLTSSAGVGYLWSTGATTQSITITASGNYSVTHSNSQGCVSAAASKQIIVNATPAVPTISQNGNELLSSASSGNQWYLNGNVINAATSQNYTAGVSGSYTVRVTNSSGCSSVSTPLQVTFLVGRSTMLRTGEEFIHNVSPNPVASSSVVSYQLKTAADVNIQVVSSSGRVMVQLLPTQRQALGYYTINISNAIKKITGGIYFIVFNINGEKITDPVMVPR